MIKELLSKSDEVNVSEVTVRGFFRAQIVDSKSGKIVGDSGWIKNKLTNNGLINLVHLLGGSAASYQVGYAALGTQTAAVNMTQTDIIGRTNSFRAVNTTTSGTATLTCTASFASSDLGASCEVGAAGLYKTNSAGSLIAMNTFATSQWNTNQDFNLTYEIRFQTA